MKQFWQVLSQVLTMLALSGPITAQQPLVDSMDRRLRTELPDTTRAMDMVFHAMYMEPVDMDRAHQLYREAVSFSLSKKLWYHAGLALRYEATPYNMAGQKQQELANIKRAEQLFLQSGHQLAKKELAATYGNFSNYYRAIEKFDSAIFYSLSAIRIQEENRFYRPLLITYINIAMIYQQIRLKDKQKEYLDKALATARQLKEAGGLFLANMQASQYYTEVGDFAQARAYIDSARIFFNENIDFSRKQTFFLLAAVSFQNLDIYDSAIHYYQKAYALARENKSSWNMIDPLLQLGVIKTKQKDFESAENYLRQGLELAEKDSARTFLKDGFKYLSELYAATGRYKESLESYREYSTVKDNLLDEERKKYILDLEEQYATASKDAQLQLQKAEIRQQRNQNYALIAGSATLVIVFLFSYRNYRQNKKLQQQRINELESEKKLAATEAVLKGEEQERTRLAKDLHDGLGGMLAGIKYSFNNMKGNLVMTPDNAQAYERSMDMLDSSIKEMRRVAQNMMPEVLLRYGLEAALKDYITEINKSGILKIISQSIGTENRGLDQTTAFALYRIIQELISNAIKHSGASELLVQTFWEPGKLIVNVEDNGKGFDVSLLKNAEGMGWKNIRSRVDFLKGTMDVQSVPGKGSFVNLEFHIA